MDLNYSPQFGHSTTQVPPIPGKYVNWPDARLRATPPPPPQPPILSPAAPYVPKGNGMASLA